MREERAGSPGVATVLVVGAVGIETITLLETKEFCGAARSSKELKGKEGNRQCPLIAPKNFTNCRQSRRIQSVLS